jgi:hypothetical protein
VGVGDLVVVVGADAAGVGEAGFAAEGEGVEVVDLAVAGVVAAGDDAGSVAFFEGHA